MTKICTSCLIEKEETEYTKKGNGLKPICKSCNAARMKVYHQSNSEKEKQYRVTKKDQLKSYREKNKEKISDQKKEWYQKNKPRLLSDQNEKRRSSFEHKLRHNLSSMIRHSLRKQGLSKSNAKWQDLVGYTLEQLKEHLENRFTPEMTWENYGSFWHIDHIVPHSWFKFEDITCDSFKACWALENLQPLEAAENIKKGNRFSG